MQFYIYRYVNPKSLSFFLSIHYMYRENNIKLTRAEWVPHIPLKHLILFITGTLYTFNLPLTYKSIYLPSSLVYLHHFTSPHQTPPIRTNILLTVVMFLFLAVSFKLCILVPVTKSLTAWHCRHHSTMSHPTINAAAVAVSLLWGKTTKLNAITRWSK